MATCTYHFGSWLVEPDLNRISRGTLHRHLEPLSMDVLVYLLEHAGETVPANELLDALWSGRVVEANAVPRVINEIRRALEDDSRRPRYIETIRKRGYRVLCTVERRPSPAEPSPEPGASPPTSDCTSHQRRVGPFGATVVVAVLGLMAVAAWWLRERYDDTLDPGSVLVTPLSSAPGDADFATVFGHGIVRRLSSVSTLTIYIADDRDVGDVKATHRLSGKVERASDGARRVALQLSRSDNGRVLWSDAFEVSRPKSDTADAIADKAARAVNLLLNPNRVAARGGSTTENPDALLAFSKGLVEMSYATADSFGRAISHFDQALALDDAFAAPWLGKAWAYRNLSNYGRRQRDQSWSQVRTYAEKALALDPSLPGASLLMADLELYDGHFESARKHMTRLRSKHPEFHHVGIVYHLAICGHLEEALLVAERTVEAIPESTWPRYAQVMVLWLDERHGEALRLADGLLAASPGDERALLERSRVLASMGRFEESVESHPFYANSWGREVRQDGNAPHLRNLLSLAHRIERGETQLHPEQAWRYYVEAYAGLGETEAAVRWLERGHQVDRWEFMWFRQMPLSGMRDVRRHPAFHELMAETVGFPSYCPAADMES